MAHPHIANYLWSGKEPSRSGNAHPNIAPYDSFPTATCNVYVAVGNDRQFATLCAELGCPEVAEDERFRRNVDRIRHRPELSTILQACMRERDGHALADRLLHIGVPAAPVSSIADVAQSDHTTHREMIIKEDHYRGAGFPIKMKLTPPALKRLPPALGQHTHDVLREVGYDLRQIALLEDAGALGNAALSSNPETD